jgi:hypothetical protein
MYKNPKIYGTPLPGMMGVLLMVVGSFDWDMAINFAKEGPPEGTWLEAEMSFVLHVLGNLIFALLLGLVLQKLDARCGSDYCPGPWFADDDRIWHLDNGHSNDPPAREMHEL